MQLKTIYKVFISNLVSNSPKGYHVVLRKFPFIITYLNKIFPMLNNKQYTLGTKVYWFLHNINDFPKCKHPNCNKILDFKNAIVTTGYGAGYCSINCELTDKNHQEKVKQILTKKYGKPVYVQTTQFKEQFRNAINRQTADKKAQIKEKRELTSLRKFGYRNIFMSPDFIQYSKEIKLKRYGNLCNTAKVLETKEKHRKNDPKYQEKINQKTRQTIAFKRLLDKNYDNNILEKRKKNRLNKIKDNPNYINDICNKISQSYYNKTGYYWPSQNPQVRKTLYRKYTYNNIAFDSMPEIAYYIWLVDNNIDFIYHPVDKILTYKTKDNKIHSYEPDFYIIKTQQLEDIKGDQFFKRKIFKNVEAKYKCMLDNNVRIIKSNEYKKYINYCIHKFNDNKWHIKYKNF